MSDIASILETVIIDDNNYEENSDDEIIEQYFISEAIRKSNMQLSSIVKWEYQLAKFIARVHLKNISVTSINIYNLMVDTNLQIIGETIDCDYSNAGGAVEVITLTSIFTMHKCMFDYLFCIKMDKEVRNKYEMLYTLLNFYYATSIKISSHSSVNDLIKSIHYCHSMVELGLIHQLSTSFTLNTL